MCLNPVRSTDGRKPCCLSFLTAQAAKLSHLHPHRSPQTPDSLDPSPSPSLSPAPTASCPQLCSHCSPGNPGNHSLVARRTKEGAEVKVRAVSLWKGVCTGCLLLRADHTQAEAQSKISPRQLSKYQVCEPLRSLSLSPRSHQAEEGQCCQGLSKTALKENPSGRTELEGKGRRHRTRGLGAVTDPRDL